MSDEEWACFEPFVTVRGAHSGRRPRDHRLVLDGIFWLARTGAQWRDLHEHFGKWSSATRMFTMSDKRSQSAISSLDAQRVVGVASGSAERDRGRRGERPDDRQHHYPGTPLCCRR